MRFSLSSVSLLGLILSLIACEAHSQRMPAEKCWVIDGDRSRYLEVDAMARALARAAGLTAVGSDSSALEIVGTRGKGGLALSAPFGSHVAIVSLHDARDSKPLNKLLRELLQGAERAGLRPERCGNVDGLRVPIIYGTNETL